MDKLDEMGEYKGRASIMDIPEEIIEHIMSHLSPYRDFKSAMRVCKQWHRIMTGAAQHQYQLFHKSIKEGSTTWSTLIPESGASISERYAHTACYHDKSMYVFGGCTSSSTTFNDLWRFDLATRQWIRPLTIGTYPSPKACASLLSHRGNLILFGGWSHPSPYPLHQAARYFNQLHMYTPSTNRWSLLTPRTSPPPTAGHSASILGNQMIIFGGSRGYGVSCNELWVLDLIEMNWYKKETPLPIPKPRFGQSQIVLDSNHLLIIGGCGGPNMQYSDVWILTLGLKDEEWKWKEIQIRNPELSPSYLRCHPACKVGESVVVFSNSDKVCPSESVAKPSVQPSVAPPKSSKLWIPPRQDEIKSPRTLGRPSMCQQCGTSGLCKGKGIANVGGFKRRLPDTSDSSQDSSSDNEEAASMMYVDKALVHAQLSSSTSSLSSSLPSSSSMAPPGGCSRYSSSPTSESHLSHHTSPVRAGMPSIRPNAMKNRQRQLETLKLYADKIRNASLKSKCNHGNLQKQRPVNEDHVECSPPKAKSSNPMYLHVLDISKAVSDSVVTWQPIRQNIGPWAPEETLFYSVVEGRAELILFGGIQTDFGSIQRVMSVNQPKVSNQVHFIHAVKTLL